MAQTSDTTCGPCQVQFAMAARNARANQREYHLIVLLMCAAVLAASFILSPGGDGPSFLGYRWPFHCWLHETLSIRCALCGMSRSFCSLAHGDIQASFGFHPLGPFLFALFFFQVPYRLYALVARPGTTDRRVVKVHCGLAALLCAAIAFNWLVYLEGLIV